jgi:L-ascorbate oxidase
MIPANISALALPLLLNETDLMLFAFTERYQALLDVEKMPAGHDGRADIEIILHNTQQHTADGKGLRWMANNATFDMVDLKNLTTPLLIDLYHGNEQNLPPNVVYTLQYNQLVDIVVQNTVAINGVCESHPMHMHGHKFWIHSYGTDLYIAEKNIWPDRSDPGLRDSLMVYASSYAYYAPNQNATNYGQPCGWTKLRMIADNPGLWMFHCHIGAHSLMGMNVLLKEGIENLSMNYLDQN